jgi:voltage-gated potassium channel
MILSSTLMYYVENEAQPDKFENIGQSLWWSVATLTTVGYGDIYPITGLGKFLSSVIALIGIGFVALPTGIISSAFIARMQKDKENEKECLCPKCGTKF